MVETRNGIQKDIDETIKFFSDNTHELMEFAHALRQFDLQGENNKMENDYYTQALLKDKISK